MRRAVWYPALMDRALSNGLEKDRSRDILVRAAERKRKLLASARYEIDADRRREIEVIVGCAERALVS
jgi:trimethylamine:corrinoid methyltransferase-like protein